MKHNYLKEGGYAENAAMIGTFAGLGPATDRGSVSVDIMLVEMIDLLSDCSASAYRSRVIVIEYY